MLINPDDFRTLPRLISMVENPNKNHPINLRDFSGRNIPVIGITGPPGAGKSTLLSQIILYLRGLDKKVAVIAIDPSSPFTQGSVLGDRIRMQNHYLDSGVFIRSLATRGHLGGLSAATSDILTVFQAYNFDYIFIETVGVGQSEVDIMGLANCIMVVLVPESGDEVQSIKAGLIEIADVLVVNKSDREGSARLFHILRQMLNERHTSFLPGLLQTTAEKGEGIVELWGQIDFQLKHIPKERKLRRLMDRVYQILVRDAMKDFNYERVKEKLEKVMDDPDFNIYDFIQKI